MLARRNRVEMKLLRAYDISKINAKLYLLYLLENSGVTFDTYRLGENGGEYQEFIAAATTIGQTPSEIAASDFYHFFLENLIEYSLNRAADCREDLHYYHPKEREIERFQQYILGPLQRDISWAMDNVPPEVVFSDELFLDYKLVYRNRT